MSSVQRVLLIGALAVLVFCGGGTAIAALTGSSSSKNAAGSPASTSSSAEAAATPTDAAARDEAAGAAVTSAAAADPASPSPTVAEVTKRKVTERKPIAYTTRKVPDGGLAKGKTAVRTAGVKGVRTFTYEVTLTNGQETARRLVTSVVTRKPVTAVVAVGTRAASKCDPNYTPCVPIASDVDCADGGGNGPAYVSGEVRVIGSDIYDLDRDGDGIGCD
jgi:hypothetical protein